MNTPANASPALELALNGISALPQWGVIQAEGEDAASFLHNQLSNDVLLLPAGQSRLAAFCSAKGRMQASFIVVKTAPNTILLVLSLDLLAQTLKRLSMFVLRAKVKLTERFEQAIDRCAMKVGARDTDSYLAEWRKAAPYEVEGDQDEIAISRLEEEVFRVGAGHVGFQGRRLLDREHGLMPGGGVGDALGVEPVMGIEGGGWPHGGEFVGNAVALEMDARLVGQHACAKVSLAGNPPAGVGRHAHPGGLDAHGVATALATPV